MLHDAGVRLFALQPSRVVGLASRVGADKRCYLTPGGRRWVTDGEGTAGATDSAEKEAQPRGYRHPSAWVLPRVSGGLGAGTGRIAGEGTVSGNLAGGYNLEASLSGSGDVTNAALGLIVSAVAALSGSSTLAADITGKLEAAASLSGSATLAANLGALAGLVASLSGSTTVVGVLSGTGNMSSDVNASSDLTVGAIADAVWDEVLSGHLTSGTTGAALNGAGSAGDPWGTELPGSYGSGTAGKLIGDLLEAGSVDGLDVLEALRVGLAVLAGKTSGFASGAGTRTVRAVDDSKDRLVAVQDENANRTATTLDGS